MRLLKALAALSDLLAVLPRHLPGGRFCAFFLLLMTGVFATSVIAGPPRVSIRPLPRVTLVSVATREPVVQVFYNATIRPKPRDPVDADSTYTAPVRVAYAPEEVVLETAYDRYQLATTAPVYRSLRPKARPFGLQRRASTSTARTPSSRVASLTPISISQVGAVCGDPKIQGEVLAPIAGRLEGCGVEDPVRVTSVDGVALSQASIMDCQTAKTLRGWVSDALKPTVRNRGRGVSSIKVAAHYACRTRNNKKGAKISEHGKGHAIDISAINLKDGSQITVLDGWKNRRDKKILSRLHASACGPFGTVLGPEADRYHLDHFHFDTARYRSGSYCR